jgi:hypothetical protein
MLENDARGWSSVFFPMMFDHRQPQRLGLILFFSFRE